MAMRNLNLTLIQPHIVWEDIQANLAHYAALIAGQPVAGHVVVLPEMFSTGFSMRPEALAEPMDGQAVQWMLQQATRHRCILTGSLIIQEEGHYYNRMVWVQPDGVVSCYDKRHLFGFAGEHNHYTAGETRTIVSVNGWRILLQVCYDLRFPVWARNQGAEYDAIIYVANWPEQRNLAWKTLLQARAIENQCYVIGVNRVGADAKGNNYSGDSSVFGPLGEQLWQHSHTEAIYQTALEGEHLQQVRKQFPFMGDADRFVLM